VADVAGSHRRGSLRVYLGAAPGVGKTFAMLNEGRRAAARGTDIVIGYVETHGRPRTAEQVGDLDTVPRRTIDYRGTTFEEMDVDAVLRRRPTRVLIDELAHTNVPGCRNEKRWQDVEELLDAGIDVISTVNIQHLESLNDVVERITGIRQRETVPDEIVRAATQIELVDQTPEALRRRMAHGNIYAPEKIDAALGNYFRPGNLAALRELALLWLADQVDVALEDYRERHGISQPWETRERVVVALTGAPGTDALVRRAARIAQRAHGELVGVHVRHDEGLAGPSNEHLDRHRRLLEDMGGEFREVSGADVGAALVDFARAENATQLVLGASHRSRWEELVRGSVINRVVRRSGPIDVHVISHEAADSPDGRRRRPRRFAQEWRRSPITPRRRAIGWGLAVAGIPLLTLLLTQMRDSVGLSTVLLVFLTLVVAIAAVGGRLAAVVAAAGAFLTSNWYFVPPIHRLTISQGENLVSLFTFLSVAVVVSTFVDTAARRTTDAGRARHQAAVLARLAATVTADDPLPVLLEHLRSVFGLDAAAVLRHGADGWTVEGAAGGPVPTRPEEADAVEELGHGVVLASIGRPIRAEDHLVLKAFAAQLATALEHGRLRVEASRARALAEANALRSALLQAVSHDLRTPLAGVKVAADSLANDSVPWTAQERAELVRTINDETDRLITLVANLLDMSRIHAGAVELELRPVALEEVVPSAVMSLGPRAAMVALQLPETIPAVSADPALLERALVNVLDNATRLSPPDRPVRVEAGMVDGHVDVRIVDRGPGIRPEDRDRVFVPFQRLGDVDPASGVGLGLAVAYGFLSAMGASIEVEDTPGGGTTMVIALAVAS
jgi:two-component system sensor histidine kinase KdpD